MKKQILAAVTACCLMAGAQVFAQKPERDQAARQRPTAEQMAQRKTDRMAEQLGLNDSQKEQVYTLNLQQIQRMEQQREQMRQAQQAEAEEMKKILTDEQFAAWKQQQQRAEQPRWGNGSRGEAGRSGQPGQGGRGKQK